MENLFTDLMSLTALIFSGIALYFTAELYWLKRGSDIRGMFRLVSSFESKDRYVSHITLENIKDRSIAIFKVFLLLGHNYYVELEDREKDPIVLRPFETYSKQYDPIDFYSVDVRRIDLDGMLDSSRNRIVLSTSEGKVVAKKWKKMWDPIVDFFKIYGTAIVVPRRVPFGGKFYGSNVKYIVVLKFEENEERTVPLYPKWLDLYPIGKFKLTEESLESKDALEGFLCERVKDGSLACSDFEVWDMVAIRNSAYTSFKDEEIKAFHFDWFRYFVLGRVFSLTDRLGSGYRRMFHRKGD